MPRCGGCGGVCGCSLSQSASIGVGGNGQPTTPWAPSVRRSLALGNTLIELADGLFVGTQTPSPVVIADTATLNMSGDGTAGNPIRGDVIAQAAPYGNVTGFGSVPNGVETDLTLGTTIELTGLTYQAPAVRVEAGNGGLYVIEANFHFPSAAGAGVARQLRIYRNGVQIAVDVRAPIGVLGMDLTLTAVLRLAALDLIKITALHDAGSAQSLSRYLRMTRTGI